MSDAVSETVDETPSGQIGCIGPTADGGDAQVRCGMSPVDIFTDGACSGNPGPGGWGAILRSGATERELSGGDASTTNNRMELIAAISALEALKRPCAVTLHTDSRYVCDGIGVWLKGWKRNGWRTASKQPVKNEDLWRRLDAAIAPHRIECVWVRGHAGHAENERCDALARAECRKVRSAA